MAEVNKLLNMACMQYTRTCRLEGQEKTHVGIALVNLLITKIYGPVILEGFCRRSLCTAWSYE